MDESKLTLIIQTLEKQLLERIEKLWRVFSWTSSILIAVTGGMIIFNKKEKLKFDVYESIIITSIILILSVYAFLWVSENLRLESKLRNELEIIFEKQLDYFRLKEIRPDRVTFGYKAVILLLGLTAVIATWIT